ncbi:histone deacetylase [Candidatus Parcubacteria bacterium]|nr:histone deacetylase [Candidatus Parcubacteria bacterium]
MRVINYKRKLIIVGVILSAVLVVIFNIFKEYSDKWEVNRNDKLPIVYSDNYDITLFGMQKLHPFDSEKYSKVANYLIKNVEIEKSRFYAPKKINGSYLLLVHTQEYLDSLKNSRVVAQIAELGLLAIMPNFIIQERLLDSVRYGTGGTVLGAELAMEEGWAINLAGGYHHTKADTSGGFGFYADVPIAVNKLWQNNPKLKVLIIDLDAHQGNGNEAIFKDDPRVFILDMYHEDNYPKDDKVKKYIDFDIPVGFMDTQGYLAIINRDIPKAIEQSQPDLIIYNAGTDIYSRDPLGKMNVSKEGIIKRDEVIFRYAKENNIPILMVLSGGYAFESARIIGESIENILINIVKYEQ